MTTNKPRAIPPRVTPSEATAPPRGIKVIGFPTRSRGLRVNIDGAHVLISRDGDSIIASVIVDKDRECIANATANTVSVRVLARGSKP